MTMPESSLIFRNRVFGVRMVSVVLIATGILLASLSGWFYLLTGLGLFGAGLLRELGLLNDKDEFQRQADYRAAYHAFLATGLAAIGLVAWFRSGERIIENPQELVTLLLVLLCFTWFLSSLIDYWGSSKAARRILLVFGCVWLAFAIVSNTGAEWKGWWPLLLHPLLAFPFLGFAWLAGYQRRITGVLLLATCIFFTQFFGWFRRDSASFVADGITVILFLGPLLASGVALLFQGDSPDDQLNTEEEFASGHS